jgi:hypothetical protein
MVDADVEGALLPKTDFRLTDFDEIVQRCVKELPTHYTSVVCQKSFNAVVAVVAEVDSSGRTDAAGLCFGKISVAQTGAVLMASG